FRRAGARHRRRHQRPPPHPQRPLPQLPRRCRGERSRGMIGGINLWDPIHVTLTADLLTAFLLGLVHGITPDEHTWPITFSYAVGSHSTKRGLVAGLIFSLAFTAQQALASELAHLGLAHLFTFERLAQIVYVIVGVVMAAAGLFIM